MGAPVSATQRARGAFRAGDLKGALRIVSGWRPSSVVSQSQLKVMSMGYECLVRPEFYRALGRDVDSRVAEAERVFVSVFFKENP